MCLTFIYIQAKANKEFHSHTSELGPSSLCGSNLTDDFGLGPLWLFIVLPGSIIVGAISSWVTLIALKEESGSDNENT
ncbi:hypothetical protein MnBA_16320 [Marinobacterium sp. BA1]